MAFKRQTLPLAKVFAQAAVFAAPAVALTIDQFGWTGLGVGVAITALVTSYAIHDDNRQVYSGIKGDLDAEEKRCETENYTHGKLDVRLQRISDSLTPVFDLPRIEAAIDPDLYAHKAQEQGRVITFSPKFAEVLTPAETAFVIGHELDHIKARDILHFAGFRAAELVNHLGFFLSAGDILSSHALAITTSASLPETMGKYLATSLCLVFSHNSIRRHCEYRADHNTLLATGDFESAVSALKKVEGEKQYSWIHDKASHLLGAHPPLNARIEKLAAAMNV